MIGTLILLFLLLPPGFFYFESILEPIDFEVYIEDVCIMDNCGIDIYIVKEMPFYCQGSGLVIGCAIYSEDIKLIFLRSGEIQTLDRFGFNAFEHEALHIICTCDFHANETLKNIVSEVDNPFQFVLNNQELIRNWDKN